MVKIRLLQNFQMNDSGSFSSWLFLVNLQGFLLKNNNCKISLKIQFNLFALFPKTKWTMFYYIILTPTPTGCRAILSIFFSIIFYSLVKFALRKNPQKVILRKKFPKGNIVLISSISTSVLNFFSPHSQIWVM